MADLLGLMKQAQAMQARLKDIQDELETLDVQGQSGGGVVRVTMSAKGALKAITLDPSLMKADETDIVEDLILAAHADARTKAERLTEEKMRAVTGGLSLPPGMKLPF